MKDKCIICEQIKEMSTEHVIPFSIGGNITLDNVCKDCNSKLGTKIDCQLTDDPFVLCLRNRYNIKDRNNNYVDLTKRLRFKDKFGNNIVFKRGNGLLSKKALCIVNSPSVEIKKTADGKNKVIFKGSDIESVFTKVKRELDKKGISYTEVSLKEKITEIAKENAKVLTIPIEYTGNLDYIKHIPCIIKIAYEVAIHNLGKDYFDDETGRSLRTYLYNYIYFDDVSGEPEVDFNYNLNNIDAKHEIEMYKNGRVVILHILLFNSLSYKVVISKNAEKYNHLWSTE